MYDKQQNISFSFNCVIENTANQNTGKPLFTQGYNSQPSYCTVHWCCSLDFQWQMNKLNGLQATLSYGILIPRLQHPVWHLYFQGKYTHLFKTPVYSKKSVLWDIPSYIITKSMRTLWLVKQLWVIVSVNLWKNRSSSELLYKSNKPQVFYGL